VLFADYLGDPDDRCPALLSGYVRKNLPEVSVIGRPELIFDYDDVPFNVAGKNVDEEIADGNFRPLHLKFVKVERVGQQREIIRIG